MLFQPFQARGRTGRATAMNKQFRALGDLRDLREHFVFVVDFHSPIIPKATLFVNSFSPNPLTKRIKSAIIKEIRS